MEREGLTAQGLVDESLKFRHGKPRHDDKMELYGDRLRDTHDLFHILTGYGRDALGEQCVLAFSYSQTPSWGTLFIARSEEHTSELQSLMRISYAVFCLKKKKQT